MHTNVKIEEELENKIKNLLSGTETISQFCFKGTEERVKRMEARSERARLQMMEKDKALLRPIIQEMIDNNELNIRRNK